MPDAATGLMAFILIFTTPAAGTPGLVDLHAEGFLAKSDCLDAMSDQITRYGKAVFFYAPCDPLMIAGPKGQA